MTFNTDRFLRDMTYVGEVCLYLLAIIVGVCLVLLFVSFVGLVCLWTHRQVRTFLWLR